MDGVPFVGRISKHTHTLSLELTRRGGMREEGIGEGCCCCCCCCCYGRQLVPFMLDLATTTRMSVLPMSPKVTMKGPAVP